MQKWEYLVREMHIDDYSDLNKYGLEGWELVSTTTAKLWIKSDSLTSDVPDNLTTFRLLFVFNRPK